MTAPAPKERELKLELPVAVLPKFRRLPLLRAINKPPKTKSQVSVYFDTDKEKLRQRGLMLRVRRSGRHFTQTVKAMAEGNIFVRDEWEADVDSAEPDWKRARDTALGPLLKRKLRRRLKPQFETRVRRAVYPLARDGYEIELTLDRGTIATGNASQPLCEIELELKCGDVADLFEVARKITRALPAQLGLQSKAERGYALLAGESGAPVAFAAAPLTASLPASEAFRRIGRACLRQITGNEAALRRGDPGGVHQMRVGLRRLRAAMSLFKALLDDPQSAAIKAGLKWLTTQLGPARELEVLVNRVVGPVTRRKSPWDGMPTLSRQFTQRRSEALACAQDAVESERFRLLTLDVAEWLEIGQWTKPSDDLVRDRGELPVAVFAAEQLSKRRKKIRKARKGFDGLDARRRHKLRIHAKKLRYAADFFAAVFAGKQRDKRSEKFLGALERVQDTLGDVNDICVHEKVISTAGAKPPRLSRKKAFAAGLLTGREDARLETVMAAADKALAQFARAKPFWR